MPSHSKFTFRNAPQIILGAFFLCFFALLSSCQDKDAEIKIEDLEDKLEQREN